MSTPKVLLFDGDCGFCRRWADRMRRATGGRLRTENFHDVRVRAEYGLSEEQCERSVQLVFEDGTILQGAEATFHAFGQNAWLRWLPFIFRVPGVRPVAERVYRWVADHRRELSKIESKIGTA